MLEERDQAKERRLRAGRVVEYADAVDEIERLASKWQIHDVRLIYVSVRPRLEVRSRRVNRAAKVHGMDLRTRRGANFRVPTHAAPGVEDSLTAERIKRPTCLFHEGVATSRRARC